MTALTSTIQSQKDNNATEWTGLYKLGAVTSLLILCTALLEILITFLPGGYLSAETVVDWFNLLHDNWFLGLRNLGLLNIVMTALTIPMFFALCMAHWKVNPKYSALAMIICFIGIAVFYATNRAFAMLDLSTQYAAPSTDAERAVLEAAGQALLAVGESHTPGTFFGFGLSAIAGMLISFVLLHGGIFSKLSAYAGILGFGMLLVYDVCQSFVPALSGIALLFAMIGGIFFVTSVGLTLGIVELVCTGALIVPSAFHWKPALTGVAAAVLAIESLVFVWVHVKYHEIPPIIMSVVLGLLMAFIAYGRMVLKPIVLTNRVTH